MSGPAKPAPAEVVHICVCCKEDVGYIHAIDLGGLVCNDCRRALICADAWLKSAGMRGCTLAHNGRFKGFA